MGLRFHKSNSYWLYDWDFDLMLCKLLYFRYERRIIHSTNSTYVCTADDSAIENIVKIKKELIYLPQMSALPHSSPLDWQTPIGYLITFLSLAGVVYPILLSSYQTLAFFAGSCVLFITFIEDITNDVELLNVGGKSNQIDKKMRLARLIQQNSNVKQLSKPLSH